MDQELAAARAMERETSVDLQRAKLRFAEASEIKATSDELYNRNGLSEMILDSFRLRN